MTSGPEDGQQLGERIRAAIESVKRDVRGLPQDQAEGRLVTALRGQDAFLPPMTVRRVARQLSDPWWPARHPLKAVRQVRREDSEPDPESRCCEAESEGLRRRIDRIDLHEVLSTFSVESTRTFEGMVHVVTIDPWSSEVADRIREVAAPARVAVKRRA